MALIDETGIPRAGLPKTHQIHKASNHSRPRPGRLHWIVSDSEFIRVLVGLSKRARRKPTTRQQGESWDLGRYTVSLGWDTKQIHLRIWRHYPAPSLGSQHYPSLGSRTCQFSLSPSHPQRSPPRHQHYRQCHSGTPTDPESMAISFLHIITRITNVRAPCCNPS